MNTSPDHPDFTALALGEHIHGTPAQVVIEALRTSVAARSEAEQIQLAGRSLAFALKGQPPLRLDAARRSAILNADPAAVRARFAAEDAAREQEAPEPAAPVRKVPAWRYPVSAVAAVAAVAVLAMKFIPGYTPPSKRGNPAVVESPSDPEPTGKVMVTLPPAGAPHRDRPPMNAPVPPVIAREPKLTPPASPPGVTEPVAPAPAVVREESVPPPARPKLPAPDQPSAPPASRPQPEPRAWDYATPLTPRRPR